MRLLSASIVGFFVSALLYRKTHVPGFPELARYVIGGLAALLAYAVLHPGDEDGLKRMFLSVACTGIGVGAARLWEALL